MPNYNEIKELYLGIEINSMIMPIPYNNLPIVFYGNSITQGASASRSGNAMCNIVSRQLDNDIINFSTSSCCKGQLSVADLIGKINCKGIVIDYTRNAYDVKIFQKTHRPFYERIRQYHPDIPIILMTTSNFNEWKGYYEYDSVVKETYAAALENRENTYLINQRETFNKEDYDLVTVDGIHYTDYGMYKLAELICNIFREHDETV